jgi:hypothetical protein
VLEERRARLQRPALMFGKPAGYVDLHRKGKVRIVVR